MKYFLILLILVGFVLPNVYAQSSENLSDHEGNYFDSIPSCDDAVLVDADDVCYTKDTPPCPLLSFNKDGRCVVEKSNLCGDDAIFKDGLCHVVNTERKDNESSPSFVNALFFMQIMLPFFVPSAIIFVVLTKTPRYSKQIRLSVCIPAIIVLLYFLSGLYLGWYPPVYA